MFRPFPILTLLFVPALALLIWLGSWQFGRIAEKADAIAAWESRLGGDTIDWRAAICDSPDDIFGHDILPPEDVEVELIRFHGRSASGELGWRLMSPLNVTECFNSGDEEYVLVQTGFETFQGDTLPAPTIVMTAAPPAQGAFDAANNIDTGEFFRFEPDQFAQSLGGITIVPDVWLIEAGDELPQHLAGVPPGQHLGYAMTWWGLAIGLFAIYLLMHVQAGRLRFTRR